MFCTVLNCMDGRVQRGVFDYFCERFGAEYADMINWPGVVRVFGSEGGVDESSYAVLSLKEMIDISVNKHGSKCIGLAGHYDCGGNPVSEAEQMEQVKRGVVYLRGEYECVEVVGVWVGKDWQVSELVC